MILIFGGTTEGRKAIYVIEQAGKNYYYSTKGNKQSVECIHGIRITGAMDANEIELFCREKNIKLLIDAAHPFASLLHQNISIVSGKLGIPVIRYERLYPERDERFIWCDNYEDAIKKLEIYAVKKLLALSGVNTIISLRPYWQKQPCWFRILDREESLQMAEKQGFPKERLIFMHEKQNDYELIAQLQPDAILTKESGYSGAFIEKTEAAGQLGLSVFVIKRPVLSEHFITVYGEAGLRKEIERLLPDFFSLRTGYTTGVYATAAVKATLTALITGAEQTSCMICLPGGEPVSIPIKSTTFINHKICCAVIKDAGDDPDVTNKTIIEAEAYWAYGTFGIDFETGITDHTKYPDEVVSNKKDISYLTTSNVEIILRGGRGIGVVTLPGLGIEIGEPAINMTPRCMIRKEVEAALNKYDIQNRTLIITLSVPEGAEIAKRTFNPKLGIVGGISIIGTSGVVHPFSNEAFIATIKKEMEIAKATGCHTVVINSGAKSERYLKTKYPDLTPQAFIHYGNFIGETLKCATELQIPEVIMGIMIGKAVKLAEGSLDTHSKKVTMNKSFIKLLAQSAGCSEEYIRGIEQITLARELWHLFPEKELEYFIDELLRKCHEQSVSVFPQGKLIIRLIDEDGRIF